MSVRSGWLMVSFSYSISYWLCIIYNDHQERAVISKLNCGFVYFSDDEFFSVFVSCISKTLCLVHWSLGLLSLLDELISLLCQFLFYHLLYSIIWSIFCLTLTFPFLLIMIYILHFPSLFIFSLFLYIWSRFLYL